MRTLLALMAIWLAVATQAAAEQRLALVVGNGAYQNIGRLDNPVPDAKLISGALRGAGFRVTLLTDATQNQMKRAILDFGRQLRAAPKDTVGLFYFAGHGVQSRGNNYLLPVGGAVRDEAELDVLTVEANWVLDQMESAGNATNIVILDACRNNPFSGAARSASRGLARMRAPTGSFIAYATAPGDVAYDGEGANSPYSAALARNLAVPGRQIEQMFKQVRVDVLSATGGLQTPWDSSSLTGDFFFAGTGAQAALPPRTDADTRLWNRVSASGDADQLRAYLALYPDGAHAGEARKMLDGGAAVAALPPTPAPSTPATRPAAQGNSVRLRISTDWSIAKPTCTNPGDLGTIDVALGAPPMRVNSTNGDDDLDYTVAVAAIGTGAEVTVTPLTPGAEMRPIRVPLDSLAAGTKVTEYSRVKLPNRSRCGSVVVYLSVVE